MKLLFFITVIVSMVLFIRMKIKHKTETIELNRKVESLRSVATRNKNTINELENKLSTDMEIAYKYNFPQAPYKIVVSKYVAEKFLPNKITFVPEYPFGKELYKGLAIEVNEKLDDYDVLFRARWEEPPVICKNCSEKERYEFSYPKEKPTFCSKECFEYYISKE